MLSTSKNILQFVTNYIPFCSLTLNSRYLILLLAYMHTCKLLEFSCSCMLCIICQDIHTSQRSVAWHRFNEGGIGWLAGGAYSPFSVSIACRHMYFYSITIDQVLVLLFLWFVKTKMIVWFSDYLHFELWQIFLSTRWAILLNLHVEMFRVNKYP